MRVLRPLEVFLIEVILYILLWLSNEYLATMLSLIFGSICFFILAVALISEWLEKSNINKNYFYIMGVSVLAPVVAATVYLLIFGELTWLKS
jgi:hypothetical protein